jgi:hypothetical protein
MTTQRIIYPTPEGVAVIIPAETVELALKDVPEGVPYEIGHQHRRAARAAEFAPHDELIAKQIPGADAEAAEAARQAIRDKYADVQDAIDTAATPDDIKTALEVTP